jgi:hypothetical protein
MDVATNVTMDVTMDVAMPPVMDPASITECDELAFRVTSLYGLFLFALDGRYQQMRAPGLEVTPRALRELESGALTLATTFLGAATREIDTALHPFIADATEKLKIALGARRQQALALVRGMVDENIVQVMRVARTGVNSFLRLLGSSHGGIGMAVQKSIGRIPFRVTDTSRRKWQPDRLMRTVVRDALYQVMVETAVDRLRTRGATTAAAVWHRDGGVIERKVFRLQPDEPASFESIRHRVFHPNATAMVRPDVPPQ